MTNARSKNLTGLFILIFSMFLLFLIFAGYTVYSLRDNSDEFENAMDGAKNSPIAVVEINGAIMDSKKIVRDLFIAEKDESIKAIIVRVDSPGGTVGPSQEIYEEIRRIDKTKPIFASFGTVAASGGYYIGVAAREIFSNPGTLTGSIGVIMQFVDLSKLYEFVKVNPTTIKSGLYKDAGNPARPLTDQEQQLLKDMIAGVHDQFRRDIIKVRGKKIKGNIEDMSQGQIFSGEEAYKLGLVDHLAGLWEAGRIIHARLVKEGAIKGEFKGLRFIKKKKNYSFIELFENVEESVSQFKQSAFFGKLPALMFTP